MWEVLRIPVALLCSVCFYPECVRLEKDVDELLMNCIGWVTPGKGYASNFDFLFKLLTVKAPKVIDNFSDLYLLPLDVYLMRKASRETVKSSLFKKLVCEIRHKIYQTLAVLLYDTDSNIKENCALDVNCCNGSSKRYSSRLSFDDWKKGSYLCYFSCLVFF